MVDKSHALVAGLFVILLGLGGAGLAIALGGQRGDRLPYIVVSRVPVSGLSPHSTVYFRGVPSGEVKSISLDPTDARQILVFIELDQQIPVTAGSFATLRSQFVTGAAQLVLDDDFNQPGRLQTSDERPARLAMRPTFVDRLAQVGPAAADELRRLTGKLDRVISEVDPKDLGRMLASSAGAVEELGAIAREVRRQLDEAPGLGRGTQRLVVRLNVLADKLGELTLSLAGTAESATRLTRAGEAAGRSLVGTTLPRVNAAVHELERAARAVDALARLLREQPQSIIRGSAPPPPGPGEAGYPRNDYESRRGAR